MEQINFIKDEKLLGAQIDALTEENPDNAMLTAQQLAQTALQNKLSSAESAACARLICRFLLHRKNKSRLVNYIRESEAIRKAVFGCLNTYKHSLIYLTKRIIRENDCSLTSEIISLMQGNQYNNPAAKPYSDKWSAAIVIESALKVPQEYLSAGREAALIAAAFINNSGS